MNSFAITKEYKLTRAESLVLNVIHEKTLKFSKTIDAIAYSQLMTLTGYKTRDTLIKAVNGLVEKELILKFNRNNPHNKEHYTNLLALNPIAFKYVNFFQFKKELLRWKKWIVLEAGVKIEAVIEAISNKLDNLVEKTRQTSTISNPNLSEDKFSEENSIGKTSSLKNTDIKPKPNEEVILIKNTKIQQIANFLDWCANKYSNNNPFRYKQIIKENLEKQDPKTLATFELFLNEEKAKKENLAKLDEINLHRDEFENIKKSFYFKNLIYNGD